MTRSCFDGALPALGVALLATASGACSYTHAELSEDVATSDLSAYVTVVDGDGAASIEVELLGPGPRVVLAPGERFVVHLPAAAAPAPSPAPIELAPKPGVEDVWSAPLPAFSGDLLLDLERVNDRSVSRVRLPLPRPFVIAAPAGPVSRAAPLPLSWSDAGSDYALSLAALGTCASMKERALSTDVGSYAIQAGLLVEPAAAPGQSCTLTVTVTRASHFEGSFGGPGRLFVNARRSRSVAVESTP